MCCILYIPANIETPSYKLLKQIASKNKHGLGYANINGTSCICPYDRFDSFYEVIRLRKKAEPCIVHFRNATRGNISDTNCQPFYDKETGIWFAHNGTLHNIEENEFYSDSEIFFYEKFCPIARKLGWDNPELWKFVDNNIERSRMIFMNNNGQVKMFAGNPSFRDWTCIDGVYYSRTYPFINNF